MAREIFSREWDRMTLQEQVEYRNRKLSHFVRTQLYPCSPFYRKLFDENGVKPEEIRGVDDLRRLPFTYKADIAPTPENPGRPEDFILKPDLELIRTNSSWSESAKIRIEKLLKGEQEVRNELWSKFGPVHIQFTTGKSALPTPIVYARDDVARMVEAGKRIIELSGFARDFPKEETRIVNAMPFAPHLGFWMVTRSLDETGVFTLHTGGGRILGTGRIASAMENLKATGIVGMPTYVYHVLRSALEFGRDLSSIRVVLVAAEALTRGMREKIAELLEKLGSNDFKIISAFGFTEARKSYSECAEGAGETGFHLYPDMDYFEIVDPETGEPKGEGEDGELAYTCLEGQGTVVMRFRTGDYVKGGIVNEPCPACGRTVPRLGNVILQKGPVKGLLLTKVKGTLIDTASFREVLSNHPDILEWQVEIDKAKGDPFEVDVVNIYIAPAQGIERSALEAQIERAILDRMDLRPNKIEFLSLDELLGRLKTGSEVKELHVVDRRQM